MSVSLCNIRFIRPLLFIPLMVFIVVGVLFSLKSTDWGIAAVAGGLAAWLPNVLFILLACFFQVGPPIKGRVAWRLALGEIVKVVATVIFLIVALGVFRMDVFPTGLTWLVVLVVQIVTPAVMNNKG